MATISETQDKSLQENIKYKRGRAFYKSYSGRTTLQNYTKVEFSTGGKLKLLHDGRLSDKDVQQIQNNVLKARKDINRAIATLDQGVDQLSEQTKDLVAARFGIMRTELADHHIDQIKENMLRIADGLHSANTEIKLSPVLVQDDRTRSESVRRAPYRHLANKAKKGLYSDRSPHVEFRLTTSSAKDANRGAAFFVKGAAINAANLQDYGDGDLLHLGRDHVLPPYVGPDNYLQRQASGRTFEAGAHQNAAAYAAFSADLAFFQPNQILKDGMALDESTFASSPSRRSLLGRFIDKIRDWRPYDSSTSGYDLITAAPEEGDRFVKLSPINTPDGRLNQAMKVIRENNPGEGLGILAEGVERALKNYHEQNDKQERGRRASVGSVESFRSARDRSRSRSEGR